MKTEKLKQNVKGYVHQFEDGGLRLLRKGQKGVIHAIFSRFGLVLILLLLQVGLLFSIFRWFGNLWPHYFGGSVVVTSAMVIYLLNSKMDNSAKITWMVVVAIAPVVGIPMFFYVKSNFGHNILRKRLLELEDQLRGWLPQSQKAVEQLKALEPGAASLAKYLYGRGGGFPVYQNTAMTYFPGGEAKFEELLRQLETAEEYIFVEYFIIDEGLMWGKILEVLARKALQGVDVRVMYDGTCEFSTLPRNYPRLLEKLNIQCKVFSPVQPFVSTHYNYRDHRKILVIDGRVGFTGGVKISEWSPGFVHAKVFVVDGREAVVGTINLDYRSLYHHFEDAVWMVDAPCIRDIEQDFQHTLEQCRTVENTSASIWQKQYLLRATGMLLKVIAPLL